MDPISLIVMALAQGAAAALSDVAADGVRSTYAALKRSIVAKTEVTGGAMPPPQTTTALRPSAAAVAAAIDDLEHDPTSIERQQAVARVLRQSGLAHDQELLAMSSELFTLLEDPLSAVGEHDRIELAKRQAGVNALQHVMDRHVDTVMAARTDHVVADSGLLTTEVERSGALPGEVRNEIAMLHVRIGLVIQQISQRIEDGRFAAEIAEVRTMPLAAAERARATTLVEADKRIHVSFQVLRNTVEFFSRLNELVLRRVEHEQDVDIEANMMLGNAVLIYELTDYVIRYIDAFVVYGEEEVRTLHREMVHRIATLRAEQERLRERANAPGIDESVRRHTLEDIDHREGAIAAFEQEWSRYLGEIDDMHSTVGEVRAKLPTLELIRENARIQIDVLQLVSMLRFLEQNTDAIRGTIDVLTGFQLAPLSASRVRRLLGVGDAT